MPFGTLGGAVTTLWLVASALLIPLALLARQVTRQPLSDRLAWAGLLAIGSFSSLLVLTVIRDAGLVLAAALSPWLLPADSLQRIHTYSALAVPILASLFTLVGLVNARRRAKVQAVDVPIAGLPASLHGFTIAQISDIHVGSTIKRGYVDAIVDAVNDLEADMIAVTGDLVDGTVKNCRGTPSPWHGCRHVTGLTLSPEITSTTRGRAVGSPSFAGSDCAYS